MFLRQQLQVAVAAVGRLLTLPVVLFRRRGRFLRRLFVFHHATLARPRVAAARDGMLRLVLLAHGGSRNVFPRQTRHLGPGGFVGVVAQLALHLHLLVLVNVVPRVERRGRQLGFLVVVSHDDGWMTS